MEEIKKVFISGPMTGLPDNNRKAFEEAEKSLKAAGFSVFNPSWLNFDNGFSDADIAAIDLAALKRCNYIYQLEGWEKSKGASAEWLVANWCGLKSVNREWLEWYVGKDMPDSISEAHEFAAIRAQTMQELAEKAKEEQLGEEEKNCLKHHL